jgi:hypothetical protein
LMHEVLHCLSCFIPINISWPSLHISCHKLVEVKAATLWHELCILGQERTWHWIICWIVMMNKSTYALPIRMKMQGVVSHGHHAIQIQIYCPKCTLHPSNIDQLHPTGRFDRLNTHIDELLCPLNWLKVLQVLQGQQRACARLEC